MDRKYLFIFEDGSMAVAKSISNADRNACDDGIVMLLDVTGSDPVKYCGGIWEEILEEDE